MASDEQLDRLRKNIELYIKMKKSGKLNGKSKVVKSKLKNVAQRIGLNFGDELKKVKNERKNVNDVNSRENPVKVPFTVTLKEIVEMHGLLRSWRRLNSMLGSVAPCYARKPWESTTSHISVVFVPDYHKKIYNLDLMIDGHVEDRFCTKGESGGFKKCLKEMIKKWGDLEIRIYDQGHAKKVLGAKRYKKQEREFAKKQGKGSKKPKSKKKKSTTPSGKKLKNGSSYKSYVKETDDSQLIPLNQLQLTSNVSGSKMSRAIKYMNEAKAGKRPKREPIVAKQIGPDKYKVVDGQTTVSVAKKAGWAKIPAVIEEQKQSNETAENKPKPKKEKSSKPAKKEPESENDIDLAAARKTQDKIDTLLNSIMAS